MSRWTRLVAAAIWLLFVALPRTGHGAKKTAPTCDDAPAPGPAAAGAFGWGLRALRVPTLGAGELVAAHIHVVNLGCVTWSGDRGDALAYHWFDGDGRVVVAEGRRTVLPMVAPGQDLRLEMEIRAPSRPGSYRLVVEPVREHVRWFGPPREGDGLRAIEVGRGALAWSLVSRETTTHGFAGELHRVAVEVRNEGSATWSADAQDFLSYRWTDSAGQVVGEGLRTPWPGDVDPGQSQAVTANLQFPDEAGRYVLRWQPVREDVAWLGAAVDDETGWRDALVVDVAGPQFAWAVERVQWPRRWWAGRTGSIAVSVRNLGADSWSPVTGDRLSYRWVGPDGVVLPGGTMRTELPYEVVPGGRVDVQLRLRAPPQVGSLVLELAMVREHVTWFPPPQDPAAARGRVELLWRGPILTAGALLVVVIALVLLRRTQALGRSGSVGVLHDAATRLWVPLVVALGLSCIGDHFVDLSRVEPWAGAGWVVGTAPAWCVLPLLVVPRRWRPWSAGAVLMGAVALALADLAYFQFFESIVPASALAAVHHLGDAQSSVVALWRDEYVRLMTPLLLLPALGLAPVLDRQTRSGAPWRARGVACGLLLVAASPALVGLGAAAAGPLATRVFSERENVGRLGLWNAHALELLREGRRWLGVDDISPAQAEQVHEFFASRSGVARSPHFGAAQGANVVVIQAEALQGWVVDAQVDGQWVMPFLHSASGEALHFASIFDQTAQGRTSDAEYLMLQSSHPMATGALAFLRADNHFNTLVHRLTEAGYHSLSAHPYSRGFWNRAAVHPRYGFERSLFSDEIGDGVRVGWGLCDREFLDRMAGELEHQSEPFVAFFITLGLHHPYGAFPPALAQLELRDLERTPLGNYLQAMRHLDSALAGFMGRLHTSGLAARTMVLLYGDHVTGMPVSDEILDLAEAGPWDPTSAVRLHRVPAVFWLPGREVHGRRTETGGQLDLAPTVLDLLGLDAPATFVGRSLLGDGPHVAVLRDGTVIDGERMWVVAGRDGLQANGCFDRGGRGQPASWCEGLAEFGALELHVARIVLDHDLHRPHGGATGFSERVGARRARPEPEPGRSNREPSTPRVSGP